MSSGKPQISLEEKGPTTTQGHKIPRIQQVNEQGLIRNVDEEIRSMAKPNGSDPHNKTIYSEFYLQELTTKYHFGSSLLV